MVADSRAADVARVGRIHPWEWILWPRDSLNKLGDGSHALHLALQGLDAHRRCVPTIVVLPARAMALAASCGVSATATLTTLMLALLG